MSGMPKQLNLVAECRALRWGLWQCPPFLFLVMGFITITSMVATYVLASRYTEEPEVAALIVIFITIIFLVIGNIIVSGFNKIAETNRMKSEFISLVSHQLRSPLSIFKWTADSIEHEIREGKSDGIINNSLYTLKDTTEGMIRLVNSLLEVSRIEARTFALKEEPFSLNDLILKIVNEFKPYAEANNVKFIFDPEPSLPKALADKDRIAMVIQNLLDNAIRYTHHSGIIEIKISKDGDYLRCIIQDQGVGIPKNQQKFIFQKFFRGNNVSHEKTTGSGIGLYIARAIIETSGGKIGFRSIEGDGTKFWFTLKIDRT